MSQIGDALRQKVCFAHDDWESRDKFAASCRPQVER